MSELKKYQKIVIAGSSTTEDSAWPTWATWTSKAFDFKNVTNVSGKGRGNELIITTAIQAAQKESGDTFILLQLTSVDKWDWYIQDDSKLQELSQEKHPLMKLHHDDSSAFWSTGCHFPKYKKYFEDHYLSLDYQTYRTLQLISWFQQLCESQRWDYHIVFDSPILSVPETNLMAGRLDKSQCQALTLAENTLCQIHMPFVDLSAIYLPGLVGYCCLNDLPWYHHRYRAHPGSLLHFEYATNIVIPALGKRFDIAVDPESFRYQAQRYQQLLDQ